jgi:hypothetical protein
MKHLLILSCIIIVTSGEAQVRQFPYVENFDTINVPGLPSGWETSTNRQSSGDFTTTRSTPYSDSNAVISTGATIMQYLISPALDFSAVEAESISFFERRSASHNSGMLLEISRDGGSTFSEPISDTISNPGTTSYIHRAFRLPPIPDTDASVRFRWRILGNGSGSTGTIRLDNIRVTAREQFDIGIIACDLFPPSPSTGDSVDVRVTARNDGTKPVETFDAYFYLDANGDTLPDESEQFGLVTVSRSLSPGDSILTSARILHVPSGLSTIIVIVRLTGDRNASNDTLRHYLSAGVLRNAVIINEIMYQPSAHGSEYVELFNRGPEAIDAENLLIADRRDSSGHANEHILSRKHLLLYPGEFLVVAPDSTLLRDNPESGILPSHLATIGKSSMSLNNDGDDIVLRDISGALIDSIRYSPSFHNPEVTDVAGRSLERINPDLPSNDQGNWSTCADPRGGTPGQQNSIFTRLKRASSRLSFFPNPFSPDGDGIEDVTVMSYNLSTPVSLIRVRIFDAHGRLIRNLANGEPGGSHGEIVWNGFDDSGRKVRMGIYVGLVEAIAGNGESVETVKGVVVVAAKL